MASEIKVDTISEKTSANGVTIDGVSLKDSKIATANSVDSDAYVDASIDNAHLADNAVDTAEIADNAVTLAKMAGLARGKLIYGDASGDPAALAAGGADEVLTHDGTDLAWAAAGGGTNTPAFSAVLNANVTDVATATWTTIVYSRELYDTGSLFDTSTGIFTCDSDNAGKWLFCYTGQTAFSGSNESDINFFTFYYYNASEDEWNRIQNNQELTASYHEQVGRSQTVMLDIANGDQMAVQYYHKSGSADGYLIGGSDWGSYVNNIFGGMRLAQ